MDVSDQVIKILNELSKKIGISIDWTQQNVLPQIRDFMHRYVLYETYTSIMWLIVGTILLGLAIFCAILSIKKWHEYYEEMLGVLIVFAIVLCIVGVVVDINQIETIIKVNTIPEVYFIDYIQSLTQK